MREDKTARARDTNADNRNMFRVMFRVLAGKVEGKRAPEKKLSLEARLI